MGVSKFDELLTILGTGRWNFLYFFICGYWFMWLPPEFFAGTYLAPEQGYTCVTPDNDTDVYISKDSCFYFINETTDSGVETQTTYECTSWEYDTSVFTSTLTSEFNLVCGRAYLKATFQSALVFATMMANPFAGYLADRYGRKTIIVISQVCFFAFGCSITLANNFSAIVGLRFITGAFFLSTIYVLSMEICEIKNRELVGVVLCLPWGIGTMIWGGLAYLLRDWRYLWITCLLPNIILFPFLYYIDESPRWLIVKGYHEKALKVLHKAARWNKVNLPSDEELKKMFVDIQKEEDKIEKVGAKNSSKGIKWSKIPVPVLLRTPKIRQLMFLLFTMYFMVDLAYTGVGLSGSMYGDDPFLFMVFLGISQIPSYVIPVPLIKWFGRKKPLAACFLIGGISMTPINFVPSDLNALILTLAMIGIFCLSSAWGIMSVFCIELLPTEIRMRGMSIVFVSAQIAVSISPYIAMYLGPLMPWIPSILYGTACFIGAAALLPLRETKGAPMLETIAEFELQYKEKLDRCDDDHADESTKFKV